MKFFEFNETERREWRELDITRAYLAELEEHSAAKMKGSVSAISAGSHTSASVSAGEHFGLAFAVDIATKVTR